VFYKSKQKMILLLFLLHHDEINKVENKPKIVLHYSKIIRCSDIFDELYHECTWRASR